MSGLQQPPQISSCRSSSRNGNVVIPFVSTVLGAFCILCAPFDGCYAKSLVTQQTRDPRAFAVTKQRVLHNQSKSVSSNLGSLFNAPAAPPTELNPPVPGTIVGAASWYNPYLELDDAETASGEWYDPDAWTAAIQIDLRAQFGGVAYGKDYRAAYALVESNNKQVIVKINDVGPLKPGRVIDLNERTMRYFDESLLLGLLTSVKVTPLPGENWTPGPFVSDFSGLQWCGPETLGATAAHSGHWA